MNLFKNQMFLNRTKYVIKIKGIIKKEHKNNMKRKKKKTVTNLDSILKSRDITLLTKVLLVKAMVFPVVLYGCESWTIKMAECRRIDAFEPWCWRRLLRVPWTVRRSNQSISDTALQGDKTQIHPTEHRHCLCAWKPGNLHKVLVQSHALGIDSTINRY